MTHLKDIYRPIEKEMMSVTAVLDASLNRSENRTITEMGNFLLKSPGKRIRTAMVILSAKISQEKAPPETWHKMIDVATAMDLIHAASLIHDDVIDHSTVRHNRPTITSKWGPEVAITLGDYLYSEAFDLIARCGNTDILQCISSATKAMCEGELLQVCERDNLELLKERYIVIVKKKTASLFAASCQAGNMVVSGEKVIQESLREYGLNFGIAFQITDDYLDVVSDEKELGKSPGQDINVGELTLPVLNLLGSVSKPEREKLKRLLASKRDRKSLQDIKAELINSGAALKTRKTVDTYIAKAKEMIDDLPGSKYKESLLDLADFVFERGFGSLTGTTRE